MMVIGPGMVILSLRRGVGAGVTRLAAMHAAPELERAGDGRHHRLVAIVADAHFDLVGEVDAVDEFQKAVNEMLARLLAVGDDVDAGILLQLHREQRGVELAGCRDRRRRAATAATACRARRARTVSAASLRWWSETCGSRSSRFSPRPVRRGSACGRAALRAARCANHRANCSGAAASFRRPRAETDCAATASPAVR